MSQAWGINMMAAVSIIEFTAFFRKYPHAVSIETFPSASTYVEKITYKDMMSGVLIGEANLLNDKYYLNTAFYSLAPKYKYIDAYDFDSLDDY